MKIIRIHDCKDCPYFGWNFMEDMCTHTKFKRHQKTFDYKENTIPNWCPLEDCDYMIKTNKEVTNGG
jgi:hypothetical protein